MTARSNKISKGQLLKYSFGQAAVAASQTDVALVRSIAETGQVSTEYYMPFDYSIVALSLATTAAATAGSLVASPTIAGTKQTALSTTITTAVKAKTVVAREKVRGLVNTLLGVKITTAAGWDAITADLAVDLYVLIDLVGV